MIAGIQPMHDELHGRILLLDKGVTAVVVWFDGAAHVPCLAERLFKPSSENVDSTTLLGIIVQAKEDGVVGIGTIQRVIDDRKFEPFFFRVMFPPQGKELKNFTR